MPASVRLVFLGGLGEIGRNCACLEVDGRILVIDCGLMFPAVDMPGVDLVLPDFTFLRDQADAVDGVVVTHGHEDHVGGLAYLLRDVSAPIYGSRPRPRPGPQPHRRGRAPRPHRADPRRGRRDRPHRRRGLRVHPGRPLGAALGRGRLLDPGGHDPAHRRLQARPHPGRRAPHRPRPPRRARPRRGPPPALGLHERRTARLHDHRVERRAGDAQPVPRPPHPTVHRRVVRVPSAPGAAGRATRPSPPGAASPSSAGR